MAKPDLWVISVGGEDKYFSDETEAKKLWLEVMGTKAVPFINRYVYDAKGNKFVQL